MEGLEAVTLSPNSNKGRSNERQVRGRSNKERQVIVRTVGDEAGPAAAAFSENEKPSCAAKKSGDGSAEFWMMAGKDDKLIPVKRSHFVPFLERVWACTTW